MNPQFTLTTHSRFFLSLILSFALLGLPACKTSKTAKGAAIGATAGGVIGGLIGKKKGNTAVGAIIGAAVGGTAGALIGKHMDKQAKEIEEDLEDAEVERVGEGILVTFNSGLLFEFGSYKLNAETKKNLMNLAETLKKYDETDLLIEGHTDNVGSDEFNQKLSLQRANSVADFLSEQGVAVGRIAIKGYGESQPVEDNETEAGRQANRRVELAITASEKMKEDAKDGKLEG